MPETAAVGDAYQVRIVGTMEGQETNNVLNFVCAGADTDVLTHLILVLASCFITHMLPVLSSSWTLGSLRWKRTRPTLGNEIITVPAGAGPGGGNAAALPSYCSAVVSIRTALGGKSHRGRMYIAGIPENATLNSFFDPGHAFWSGLAAFLACVVTNFVVGDPPGAPSWQMEVYSRKLGGATFPYGAAGFTPMKSLVPVAALGTTRSRKVGRGS